MNRDELAQSLRELRKGTGMTDVKLENDVRLRQFLGGVDATTARKLIMEKIDELPNRKQAACLRAGLVPVDGSVLKSRHTKYGEVAEMEYGTVDKYGRAALNDLAAKLSSESAASDMSMPRLENAETKPVCLVAYEDMQNEINEIRNLVRELHEGQKQLAEIVHGVILVLNSARKAIEFTLDHVIRLTRLEPYTLKHLIAEGAFVPPGPLDKVYEAIESMPRISAESRAKIKGLISLQVDESSDDYEFYQGLVDWIVRIEERLGSLD